MVLIRRQENAFNVVKVPIRTNLDKQHVSSVQLEERQSISVVKPSLTVLVMMFYWHFLNVLIDCLYLT